MVKKVIVSGRVVPPIKKIIDILPYTVGDIVESFVIDKCLGKNTSILVSKIDKEIKYHEDIRKFHEDCISHEDKILIDLYNSKSIVNEKIENYDPIETQEYKNALEEFEYILQCRLELWKNQKFGRECIKYSTAVDFAKKANVKTEVFLRDIKPELLEVLEER